jgi:hypothetical protein
VSRRDHNEPVDVTENSRGSCNKRVQLSSVLVPSSCQRTQQARKRERSSYRVTDEYRSGRKV